MSEENETNQGQEPESNPQLSITTQITVPPAGTSVQGNRWWQLRSRHGRQKLFESPELLREAANEYFAWCEDNPLLETKAFAHEGYVSNHEIPKKRVYQLVGFLRYVGASERYLHSFEKNIRDSNDPQLEGFLEVLEYIRTCIHEQKFEGAASGFFNANLISRDLGLVDKRETEVGLTRFKVSIEDDKTVDE
jgi:hypothetical protein